MSGYEGRQISIGEKSYTNYLALNYMVRSISGITEEYSVTTSMHIWSNQHIWLSHGSTALGIIHGVIYLIINHNLPSVKISFRLRGYWSLGKDECFDPTLAFSSRAMQCCMWFKGGVSKTLASDLLAQWHEWRRNEKGLCLSFLDFRKGGCYSCYYYIFFIHKLSINNFLGKVCSYLHQK